MRRLFSKTAAFSFCGRLKGFKWADADVERWVELNLEAARGHAGIVIELPSSPPRETSFSSALATQDEVMHPSEVITLRRLPSTPLVLQMMRSGCGPGVFLSVSIQVFERHFGASLDHLTERVSALSSAIEVKHDSGCP